MGEAGEADVGSGVELGSGVGVSVANGVRSKGRIGVDVGRLMMLLGMSGESNILRTTTNPRNARTLDWRVIDLFVFEDFLLIATIITCGLFHLLGWPFDSAASLAWRLARKLMLTNRSLPSNSRRMFGRSAHTCSASVNAP